MLSFDWDDSNLGHIAAHGVSREEAEFVLTSPSFEIDHYIVDGEERVEEVGATGSGHILKVVVTVREGQIRVITAYDASRLLKHAFMEHQRKLYE